MACRHVSWLQVNVASKFAFNDGKRLQQIAESLPNPTKQTPSIFHFVGGQRKDEAIIALYDCESVQRQWRLDSNSIRLDQTTRDNDSPLYIAESDGYSPGFKSSRAPVVCHEACVHQIRWKVDEHDEIWKAIHCRLFFPFADVICLFADDIGGLTATASYIRHMIIDPRFAVDSELRPRLVVVSTEDSQSVTSQILDIEELREQLQQDEFSNTFSNIYYVRVDGEHHSPKVRYRSLKLVLEKHASYLKDQRHNFRQCFSAMHLSSLFSSATRQLAQSFRRRFDHLIESHQTNALDDCFKEHVERCIRLCKRFKAPKEAITTYIASSILLDAYPPRMHLFDPSDVYRRIYGEHITRALIRAHPEISRESIQSYCEGIEDGLIAAYTRLSRFTAAEVYLQDMRPFQGWWRLICTNKSCVCCLRRVPEQVLPCRHALCESCIRIFGKTTPTADDFLLEECPFCGHYGSSITIKPATAGASIISIDGGGTRGVIPLEFLKLVQDQIGSEVRIQKLIDLAIGTSAGGLIVPTIFLKGFNIDHALDTFKTMARNLFGDQAQGLTSRVRSLFRGVLSDGLYDTARLEDCLKAVFGSDQRLFDYYQTQGGTKVAVTACNLIDSSPRIFTNYNGIGPPDTIFNYPHIRPDEPDEEPLLWQACRATSAAPFFFAASDVPGVGGCQDGGLKENMPCNVADTELQRIWPELCEPAVAITLGTGADETYTDVAPYYTRFKDHSILRTARSFASDLRPDTQWRKYQRIRGRGGVRNHRRLDIDLSGQSTRLDDTSSMESLSKSVYRQVRNPKIMEIAFALIVSRLYFVLDARPRLVRGGHYLCRATIRCRLPSRAFWSAMNHFSSSLSLDLNGDPLSDGIDAQAATCQVCHRFRSHIKFLVPRLDTHVTITVRGGTNSHTMGAFPQNMAWFIKQQGLEAVFGESHHSCPRQFYCDACNSRARNTRKRAGSQPMAPDKKFKTLPALPLNL